MFHLLFNILYTPYNFQKVLKQSKHNASNSGINKRIKTFTHSDNKGTIFCNSYIVKYLKYVFFNSKHFTTASPLDGTHLDVVRELI